MSDIEGQDSQEMYLKTIYLINKEKGYCRHVDIANRLAVSKPSVSVAVSKLVREGFLKINEDGMIILTDDGKERARLIYEKFCFWVEVFKEAGLDPETARGEACKCEHDLSDKAFFQIKQAAQTK